jgi:hypothetical protein
METTNVTVKMYQVNENKTVTIKEKTGETKLNSKGVKVPVYRTIGKEENPNYGRETFAVTIRGNESQNVAKKLAYALVTVGGIKKDWKDNTGKNVISFSLNKPVYFHASNGIKLSLAECSELHARLKFTEDWTEENYEKLVNDLLRIINL